MIREVNDNDTKEMLAGIAQILSGVEDIVNRKELAKIEILKLKDEGIEFDVREFLKQCGFNTNMAVVSTSGIHIPTSRPSRVELRVKVLVEVAIIKVILLRNFSGSAVKSSLAFKALSGLLAEMRARSGFVYPGSEKSSPSSSIVCPGT
jgi:hypothetical protein